MFIYSISGHTHASITGKPVSQARFFSHFCCEQYGGNFTITIKIIDKVEDALSIRRNELFWQYKLGNFAPTGLNERAADFELVIFAFGVS